MGSDYVYKGNDIYRGVDPSVLNDMYRHREPPPVNDVFSAADSGLAARSYSKHDLKVASATRKYEMEAQVVQDLVAHLAEANKKLLVAMAELRASLDEAAGNTKKPLSS